jgi:hypothetical protein
MLETLEFHVRKKVWILIVQVDNEPNVNLIVFKMVDERSASGIAAQRPPHRMRYRAFAVLVRVDFTDFFNPKAEFLRLLAL